jgi:tetratricopeptide (TPR) repeat protein
MLLEFAKKAPGDPFPQYGVAMEYKNMGKLTEAAAAFGELLSRHPDYTPAYLHAGNLQVQLGQRDDARKTYESGIEACRKKGDFHALSELEGALAAL